MDTNHKTVKGIRVGLLFWGCLSIGATTSLATAPLRVIALTDTHGALEAQFTATKTGAMVESGGAGLLSTYVQRLRNSDQIPTIILDAGDLFQGTLVSNTTEGRPVIDFYNHLRVDAAAVGNHDFDYGPVGPKTVPTDPSDDPRGALKARVEQAHFPFLAVNLFEESGERPEWAKASILIKRAGLKIGVIGFADPSTPSTTNRKNLVGLKFVDPLNPILSEMARLRAEGVDYIVLVGHEGGGCKDNSEKSWKNLDSCTDGALFDLLKRLPPRSVDLAIGGHTHQGISKEYLGIPVLQPFSNSQYMGSIVLSKDESGQPKSTVGKLTQICGTGVIEHGFFTCNPYIVKNSSQPPVKAKYLGSEVEPDSEVLDLLRADFESVQALKAQPLGVTLPHGFERSYFDENAMGNFLADVLKHYFMQKTELSPDVVLLNNGGTRDSFVAGPLTYGDVFRVIPFDNLTATMDVPGSILKKMLEIGISRQQGGISWSGVTFTGNHCVASAVQVNGLPLDPEQTYRVVATDFVAQGGIHFDSLQLKPEQIHILDTLPNQRDLLVEGLKTYQGSLQDSDYYSKSHPRQRIESPCP